MAKSKIERASCEIEYIQDSDCCQEGDLPQVLRVKTQDGGGGHYLVIETERWAIDDPEAFVALLREALAAVKGPEA